MEEIDVKELKKKGYSILNLKGHKENFDKIKNGDTDIVEKEISFRTQPKFLTLDDKGEVVPRKYDFLCLTSGSEKLVVAVTKSEWFIVTEDDEMEKPITHKDVINGKEVTWTECLIQYTIKLLNK